MVTVVGLVKLVLKQALCSIWVEQHYHVQRVVRRKKYVLDNDLSDEACRASAEFTSLMPADRTVITAV